jgi:hypothetical protein
MVLKELSGSRPGCCSNAMVAAWKEINTNGIIARAPFSYSRTYFSVKTAASNLQGGQRDMNIPEGA